MRSLPQSTQKRRAAFTVTKAVNAAAWSTCKIAVTDPDGKSSNGSGVYIGDRLVLTCAHAFDHGGTTGLVKFQQIKKYVYAFKLIKKNRKIDQALIELTAIPNGIKGVKVAEKDPVRGEGLVLAGYQQGQTIEMKLGSNATLGEMTASKLSSIAVDGDSGGPVFNFRGELIGNLHSRSPTDNRTVYVTCFKTRAFLLPWRNRIYMMMKNNQKQIQEQRIAQPEVKSAPITDLVVTDQHLTKIADIIWERMQANPGAFKGVAGKDGADGTNSNINQITIAVLKQLPPIRVKFQNPNAANGGEIVSFPIGEPILIPPVRLQIHKDGKYKNQTAPLGDIIAIRIKSNNQRPE